MISVLMHMSGLFSDENWSPEGALSFDFRGLSGTTCYCSPEAEQELEKVLSKLPLHAVHWIDTGDFHYLSALWLRKLKRPARLFLFDNHPDDQEPAFGPGLLSCGSWVKEVRLNNPMVKDNASEAYLSIDLDFLSKDFARTDWDQGKTSLDELMQSIQDICSRFPIADVDICGGITSAQGGRAEDFSINRRTRNILLEYFSSLD